MRIAITGSAGKVGTLLRPSLRDDHDLVLLDREVPTEPAASEVVQVGELTDARFLDAALAGASAVIHLAGCASPRAGWDVLAPMNIGVTTKVLDAALRAGIGIVVYASSNHAAGQYELEGTVPVQPYWPARPCCRYGASKAAAEAITRWYSTQGVRVACLRLGWTRSQPHTTRALSTWLSPGDLGRLVRAALDRGPGFGIYYGVSANGRGPWDITNARDDLGYEPRDRAEDHAAADLIDDDQPACQIAPGGTSERRT